MGAKTRRKSSHKIKLCKAVIKGNVGKTKELLKSHSINLNSERYFDYDLVIEALSLSQIVIAKLLIEKGFRVYKSESKVTILEYAVRLNDIDLIKTVLAKGASPDILSLNKNNKTPFHLAIDKSRLFIIELFLSQFDVKTFDKSNLLHYAIEKLRFKVVAHLIEKGFSLKKKNDENLTPFCVAMKNDDRILDLLLSYCPMKDVKLNNFDDIAPAYIASIHGNLEVIKKYVDSGLSINSPLKLNNGTWQCLGDFPGFTLLHIAVKHYQLEVVKFLLSIGADILVQNESGLSSLHTAFERDTYKSWLEFENNHLIIDLILKANMKFRSNPVNKNKLSHFHIACSRDEPMVVEHFLKLGARINQPVKAKCHFYEGFSPLHFAVKFRCTKTLELLLKNGAYVKQRDCKKMTALHIAVQESCLNGVRLLLQYGADITSIDSHGKSPVHLAFEKKNYPIIDLLLSVPNVANSNPTDTEGLSHFHIACTRNNVHVVKSFIDNGALLDTCVPVSSNQIKNSNVTSKWSGYSPLHFATTYNRAKIVQLLLHSGANVKVKDSYGCTPLHAACKSTDEKFEEFVKNTVRDLSKVGKLTEQLKPLTDVTNAFEEFQGKNSGTFNGSIGKINWSPNRRDHLKIIDLLLNYESDVNCSDYNGNTPILYAYCEIYYMLDSSLDWLTALWTEIYESLSIELSARRKLILINLLKLDVNLNKCYKNGSIFNFSFSEFDDEEGEEITEMFLKKGANVNVTNHEMLTPLHQATINNEENLVRMLLNYNANVDCICPENNLTPLLIATSTESVFFSSCIVGIVKVLIDKGANANAKQSDGRTALHNLALQQFGLSDDIFTLISALVKTGANVNSRDSRGFTPLHLACVKRNYDTVNALLKNGADIGIEDNKRRNVCCYLYEKYLKSFPISESDDLDNYVKLMINNLQSHVVSMIVIGLPVSNRKRALFWHLKCCKFLPPSDQKKKELIDQCKIEIQSLKDKKINAHCTFYSALFKNENSLSKLVKNRTFQSIVQSRSIQKYVHYGYLIQLKYYQGIHRANLLPKAKCLLNNLGRLHLPDTCSENICKYFTNFELRESVETLSSIISSNVVTLETPSSHNSMQLRSHRANKRQKVN